MLTEHSGRLTVDWFDTEIYGGCIAVSIVLPDYVPFQSVFPIRVVEDFFENRGNGVAGIDDGWMTCPYLLLTKWIQVPWPIHPRLEDISIAENALVNAGIGPTGEAVEATNPVGTAGHPRSVVIMILPVKQLAPALESREGKLNALTFVHWVLAQGMRAVRIGTGVPIQDLTLGRMPVVIPIRYAEVVDGALQWRDDKYDMFSDDFLDRTLPPPLVPSEVVDRVGHAFGQLTWGRPSAMVLDHIKRCDSAAKVGDDVGALLAYATACEVAIVNLAALALRWEDGESAGDVAPELRDISASSMVPSLCHALGGNWSLDAPGPARSGLSTLP